MRVVTWVPDAISVSDGEGPADGLRALVIDEPGTRTVIPLADGDARRIGSALLGLEVQDDDEPIVAPL